LLEGSGSIMFKKSKRSKKQKVIETIVFLLIIALVGGGFVYKNFIGREIIELPKKEEKKPEEPKLQIIDLDSKSRPFAVMINNVGVSRPLQSGLQDAYIVYEMIVEGGITRKLALFLDTETERIGSVRSARHYFLDYAAENDAIYVHHGQSPQSTRDFSSLGIDRINVDGTSGWRDTSIRVASEHRLFTSMERLVRARGNRRSERNKDFLLDYSIESINLKDMENAEEASEVKFSYSNTSRIKYVYDSDKKVYKRYFNESANTDYVTKETYTFKNIIVYSVQNVNLDGSGRQTLHNVGDGKGYFISEGYAVPITWSKSSRTAQTVYKFENGDRIKVNDGNTFINIIPKGRDVSFS